MNFAPIANTNNAVSFISSDDFVFDASLTPICAPTTAPIARPRAGVHKT